MSSPGLNHLSTLHLPEFSLVALARCFRTSLRILCRSPNRSARAATRVEAGSQGCRFHRDRRPHRRRTSEAHQRSHLYVHVATGSVSRSAPRLSRRPPTAGIRLGPGYAPLAYSNVSDRGGIFGSGDYRVHGRVWVNGVFNRRHNNVRAESTRPSFDATSVQLGTRIQLGQDLFVSARGGEASAVGVRVAPASTKSRVRTYYGDIWRNLGRWSSRSTDTRSTFVFRRTSDGAVDRC